MNDLTSELTLLLDNQWLILGGITIGGLVVGCAIAVRILVGVARALRDDENG